MNAEISEYKYQPTATKLRESIIEEARTSSILTLGFFPII